MVKEADLDGKSRGKKRSRGGVRRGPNQDALEDNLTEMDLEEGSDMRGVVRRELFGANLPRSGREPAALLGGRVCRVRQQYTLSMEMLCVLEECVGKEKGGALHRHLAQRAGEMIV